MGVLLSLYLGLSMTTTHHLGKKLPNMDSQERSAYFKQTYLATKRKFKGRIPYFRVGLTGKLITRRPE